MTILYFELYPEALGIGMLIIVFLLAVHWKQGRSLPHLLSFFLFSSYLLVLLDVVFLPVRVPEGWPRNVTIQQEAQILSRVNLIPFFFGDLFAFSQATVFWELAGNILLTIPFGFGLPFLTNLPAKRTVWVCLILGPAIEAAQLVILLLGWVSGPYGHSVDINDMILNTCGVLLGYGLFRLSARFSFVQRFREHSAA